MSPTLSFPYEFDERAAFEAEQRGLCADVRVTLPNGLVYEVNFYDPTRLGQTLAHHERIGEPCVADPGLIVISTVTLATMQRAVDFLYRSHYFDSLVPMSGAPGETR